jgi:hypothetical protein
MKPELIRFGFLFFNKNEIMKKSIVCIILLTLFAFTCKKENIKALKFKKIKEFEWIVNFNVDSSKIKEVQIFEKNLM